MQRSNRWIRGDSEALMLGGIIGLVIVVLIAITLFFGSFYTIGPSERGVKITMGKMDEGFLSPGLGFKMPIISEIKVIPIKTQVRGGDTVCFSSDLQQVTATINVLYHYPETSVVRLVRDYQGDGWDTLISSRVTEALKEITAQYTASDIAKEREAVKQKTLALTREKIGSLIVIEDINIINLTLSKELEDAIEQKMVRQQHAEQAQFELQKAEVDAKTRVVAAKAEAESIQITGDALQKNPALVSLKWVEKWNGVMPTTSLGGSNSPAPVVMVSSGSH